MKKTDKKTLVAYVSQISAETGIKLSGIDINEGQPLGIVDMDLLVSTVGKRTTSVRLSHDEVRDYLGGIGFYELSMKICAALKRMPMKLEANERVNKISRGNRRGHSSLRNNTFVQPKKRALGLLQHISEVALLK